MMTIGAWAFKPGAKAVAWFDWSAAAWWLAVPGDFGSLLAFTTYLRLIAAWGPARAGSYTYVFPVFAVLLGVVLLHENFGLRDGFGMSLLLVAAFCSLRTSRLHTRQTRQRENWLRQIALAAKSHARSDHVWCSIPHFLPQTVGLG